MQYSDWNSQTFFVQTVLTPKLFKKINWASHSDSSDNLIQVAPFSCRWLKRADFFCREILQIKVNQYLLILSLDIDYNQWKSEKNFSKFQLILIQQKRFPIGCNLQLVNENFWGTGVKILAVAIGNNVSLPALKTACFRWRWAKKR